VSTARIFAQSEDGSQSCFIEEVPPVVAAT
jgi:hypothetical protein